MTTRREAFLSSRAKCPRCAAARIEHAPVIERCVRFECGACFAIDGAGKFTVWQPCPRDSERVVRHWNQQTKEGEADGSISRS